MNNSLWSINDLIDLEYFLHRYEDAPDDAALAALKERDRYIYLNKIVPLKNERPPLTPARIIRFWLDEQKEMETSPAGTRSVLPGAAFDEIYRLLVYGFMIVGILTGSGLAASFLNYRGTEPLNISHYLAGFVFVQCLALVLLVGMTLIRKIKKAPFHSSVVYMLISGLMTSLIKKIRHHAIQTVEGSKRGHLGAAIGLIKGKRRIYGSLFYWPVFILAQIFGIGFNVGVLGATLLKVLGSDIAFGWQSTVQFSTQAVFRLVQAVAFPWSWCVPADIAYPTRLQIEGSHMVLKDGIYHLSTQDLVSWWPFLCFAVFTYGLLPRVILLITGLVAKKRALSRIDFGHAASASLLHRMTTPLVSTDGGHATAGPFHGDEIQISNMKTRDPEDRMMQKPMIALIPDDIFDACSDNELERAVYKRLGGSIEKKLRFGEDEKGDQKVLEELVRIRREEGAAPLDVLIVQEAWQPPIKEHLLFIQDLRKVLEKTSMIWVGLIGKPTPGSIFTPVKEDAWTAWRQRMKSLGDPYLGVERLVADGA
ncbi:MAG: DUF2868 domain-containing protein [Deltaproteobacteria bacterium]|nr:DUF2868 domain-containing protein [Deltaproteobacteria bacterium]